MKAAYRKPSPPFCPMLLLHTATAKQHCPGRLRNTFTVCCTNSCLLLTENLTKMPIPGPRNSLSVYKGSPSQPQHFASRFTPALQHGPLCPPGTGTPPGCFKLDREVGQICVPPVSSQPESLELINKRVCAACQIHPVQQCGLMNDSVR